MTPQEALEILQEERDWAQEPKYVKVALSVVEKVLEKQIPKKPWKESLADRDCPSCGAYLNFDLLNEPVTRAPAFCECCGQALDWSEEE